MEDDKWWHASKTQKLGGRAGCEEGRVLVKMQPGIVREHEVTHADEARSALNRGVPIRLHRYAVQDI